MGAHPIIPILSFFRTIYSRLIFIVRTIRAYHFLLDSDVPLAFRHAICRFCLFSFPFLEEGNSRHECIPSSLSEKITEKSLQAHLRSQGVRLVQQLIQARDIFPIDYLGNMPHLME